MIQLTLPWPPSVNAYWRHIAMHGRPRTLISAAGRDYREAVRKAVNAQRAAAGLVDDLRVSVVAYPPDRRARDVDNLLKALLDSLQHAGVYVSDSQIVTLQITKSRTVHPGGVLAVSVAVHQDRDVGPVEWRNALREDAA